MSKSKSDMSKLTISIFPEAHAVLKEWAAHDDRSLSNYITVLLGRLTGAYKNEVYLPIEIKHTTKTITQTLPVTEVISLITPENPAGRPILTNDITDTTLAIKRQ